MSRVEEIAQRLNQLVTPCKCQNDIAYLLEEMVRVIKEKDEAVAYRQRMDRIDHLALELGQECPHYHPKKALCPICWKMAVQAAFEAVAQDERKACAKAGGLDESMLPLVP